MKKPFFLPAVFFAIGFLLLALSVSLFVLPLLAKQAVSEELISPLILEPPAGNILQTSLFQQIKEEKTTDHYPPNKYFPTSLEPLYPVDLKLSAKAYAVMDKDTNTLLLAKEITTQKQIASLTKIMTALVALDKEQYNREIVISKSAASIGEAVMGVSEGERYTIEELLYGLLMVSGNDAAEAIAQNLGRGRFWFIEEMNKKAYGLGLRDTYFVNPTGLDEATKETSSFSTALDLLALANYALNNQKFAEIVATKYYTIPYKENFHKQIFLENILNFDKTYPGIKGIKTGNTHFADQTLISYADYLGRKIIVVLLDSQATRDDAVKVYRYLFENKLE